MGLLYHGDNCPVNHRNLLVAPGGIQQLFEMAKRESWRERAVQYYRPANRDARVYAEPRVYRLVVEAWFLVARSYQQ